MVCPSTDDSSEVDANLHRTYYHGRHARSWSTLDAVAIYHIAQLLFPASAGLLDSSLRSGLDSPWCRLLKQKVALASVCRHWRDVTLAFIYRDLSLRRVKHVFAFAETLECHSGVAPGYASFVRSLTITCFVPEDLDYKYSVCVAQILGYCVQLEHLTFGPSAISVPTPHRYLSRRQVATPTFLPPLNGSLDLILQSIAPRLTSLHIHDTIDYLHLCTQECCGVQLLRACQKLVSLSLPLAPRGTPAAKARNTMIASYSHLRFDNLEELHVFVIDFALAAMVTWQLPRLRRVILHTDDRITERFGVEIVIPNLGAFFDLYGPRIQELVMDSDSCLPLRIFQDTPSFRPYSSMTYLQCPAMFWKVWDTHLDLSTDPAFGRLRVDLWSYLHFNEEVQRNLSHIQFGDEEVGADSLNINAKGNIRFLDHRLADYSGLAEAIRPSRPFEKDSESPSRSAALPVVHNFFGLHVIESSWALMRLDTAWDLCELRNAKAHGGAIWRIFKFFALDKLSHLDSLDRDSEFRVNTDRYVDMSSPADEEALDDEDTSDSDFEGSIQPKREV
ncbi:hypothetical protein BXZ70DRAFT_923138 [Cristinia sonorae]|uniref:Uncharacterized protein n=1 Tax=Cristinia sonorae TaxID=1940300 RepID=A0A8K0UUR3_9AGAR|nr:hypothetical protein BXZ70DRAFT_923138 [Cristinia sonorae]